MRLGKVVAALLVLVGALLVPATTAQAESASTSASASCAPAEQSRWLGTYRGPHYYHTGELYGVLDITVYVDEHGEFRVMQFTNWSSRGLIRNGLLDTGGSWLFGMRVTSATCGSDGRVTEMTGGWWRNYNLECATCIISGPFEAVRIS
jgi:hypothetical protein